MFIVDIKLQRPSGEVVRVRKVPPVTSMRAARAYERELRQALADAPRRRGKFGESLAPASVANHIAVLRRVLNVTRRWELIERVPTIVGPPVWDQRFDRARPHERPAPPAPSIPLVAPESLQGKARAPGDRRPRARWPHAHALRSSTDDLEICCGLAPAVDEASQRPLRMNRAAPRSLGDAADLGR